MPIRMINFVTAKPPARKYRNGSPITRTEEWQDFCIALGAGLKPNEYVEISFPLDHPIYQELKQPTTTFLMCARAKLKELHAPYDVYCRNNIIYVVGRGAVS